MTTRFALVDVFASRPLTGNPLAVVPEGDRLGIDQMRAIAREFNQSETTFLLRPTNPDADVRLVSITPGGVEVGGAGHNALGAWLWLAQTGRVAAGSFTQQIGADLLEVEVGVTEHGQVQVAMQQSPPTFGPLIDSATDLGGRLASALGLTDRDLDSSSPTQIASTGATHLLVAVRDRATVDRATPDPGALLTALREAGGEGCYVYTTAPSAENVDAAHAYARFFNPTVGIAEDPATGTAAGPLAAALVHAGQITDGSSVHIEQGHALGRPSRLVIDVHGDSVRLSGSGLIVGEGRLATGHSDTGDTGDTEDTEDTEDEDEDEDDSAVMDVVTNVERGHLRTVIKLAATAARSGELPFASLLADADGAVLASDINTVRGSGDISAHPELKLARWAALTYPSTECSALTLYTSCEPCVMCANAIARAGLGRVVYALSTEQLHRLEPAGVPRPDSAPVRYDGPLWPAAAAEPVRAYYDQ